MPTGVPKAPLEERFMRRVDTSGPIISADLGHCWIWTGRKQQQGYGTMLRHVWGEILAHRWMYRHTYGELAVDVLIRHKCDIKDCVNPAHLESGTSKDNVHDMIERNPHACGRKLSDEQITEIVSLRSDGIIYTKIAEKFGVNRRTIEKICIGRRTYAPIHVVPTKTRMDILDRDIVRLYKEGWANSHITKLLKCSSATVVEILKVHPELNRTIYPITSTKATTITHILD